MPKLEKWFGEKQNILVRVDADVDVQELYSRVESILHQAMLKTQGGEWLEFCNSAQFSELGLSSSLPMLPGLATVLLFI